MQKYGKILGWEYKIGIAKTPCGLFRYTHHINRKNRIAIEFEQTDEFGCRYYDFRKMKNAHFFPKLIFLRMVGV